MSKYTVDIFTEKTIGSQFPENSYQVNSALHVAQIIDDVTGEESGIVQIQIQINKGDS